RRLALRRAWDDKDPREVLRRLSLRSAWETARERLADGRRRPARPRRRSRIACFLVLAGTGPRPGGGSLTPALPASARRMGMACCGELAPCLLSRTCSLASRTNSPAWVDGDFPSLESSLARSMASPSGMTILSLQG